jgi:hypothetical protein
MAKKLAVIAGVVFVLVGIVGFVNNPLASSANPDALFLTDELHNIVHLLFGVALLIASRSESGARKTLIVSGVLYLLLAVVGFVQFDNSGEGKLLGLVTANGADNWLHLILGLVLGGAGLASKANDEMLMDRTTM